MVVLLVHLEAGDGDLDGCIGERGLAFQYIFDREIAVVVHHARLCNRRITRLRHKFAKYNKVGLGQQGFKRVIAIVGHQAKGKQDGKGDCKLSNHCLHFDSVERQACAVAAVLVCNSEWSSAGGDPHQAIVGLSLFHLCR